MEALAIIERLLDSLSTEGVRYCHWKSNQALDRSFDGSNDLDLLIDPADRFRFSRALVRLGFKQAFHPKDRRFPGMFNFYGHDAQSGAFVHVHAHYRLVVGCDLIKNYELPLVEAFLDSAAPRYGMPVPSPELEYIVFVLRMTLKRRLLAWAVGHPDPRILLLTLFGSGRPPLSGSEADEWLELRTQVDANRVRDLLEEHLPFVSTDVFRACEDALEPEASRWAWLGAGNRLTRALLPCRRVGTVTAGALAAWRRFQELGPALLHRLRLWSPRPKRRRLAAGGQIVAFVGGDGSGKTTNVNELERWLGSALDCRRFHLGRPEMNVSRHVYLLASKAIRLPMGDPREVEVPALHAINHLLVARHRWRIVRKVHRLAAAGSVVICDRYPLEVLATAEAEFIAHNVPKRRGVPFLARLEQRYYRRIRAMQGPDSILVLRVDPDMAIARKPEDDPVYIRPRLQEIFDKDWSEVPGAHVIDASRSSDEVFAQIREKMWKSLPSWSPRVEIMGVAGAGKTTLANRLRDGGGVELDQTAYFSTPRAQLLLLSSIPALWWAWPHRFSWQEFVQILSIRAGLNRAVQRIVTPPLVFDQGPLYDFIALAILRANEREGDRFERWFERRRNLSVDFIDLVIRLEARDATLKERIEARPTYHGLKGRDVREMEKFSQAYSRQFSRVLQTASGGDAVSIVSFDTETESTGELARKVSALLDLTGSGSDDFDGDQRPN